MSLPAIVLLSPDRPEVYREEFWRYSRDYDLRTATTAAEAEAKARSIVAGGGQVALFVTDSLVSDATVVEVFARLREIVPTARRAVISPMERFLADAPPLRPAMARGKFDAHLLLPRGARDEEFHHAISDLLSDWGSTVPEPEAVTAKVVAQAGDPLALAIRDFFTRMGMPVRTYQPDTPIGEHVRALVPEADRDRLPLVATVSGNALAPRSVRDVAVAVYGAPSDLDVEEVVDLVVVGAGPAGLATAVYAASEGLSTVVLEAEAIGGQAGTSSMIRNYLGFPRGISGMRLAARARNQALRFGTRFHTGWAVTELVVGDRAAGVPHRVVTDGGDVRARAVVIASGVSYRKLRVEPLEQLVGQGVFYGAAMTASREMEGQDVVVVGGGNSAGQAAVHLARYARSVTIVIRRETLAETMSSYLIHEIAYSPTITVQACTEVVDGGGNGRLEWLILRDVRTGATSRRPAYGLFLLLGAEPHCEWLPDAVARDEAGYVVTGRATPRATWPDGLPPAELATSVPGVFAAGDIRAGSMKRVASASGEGASVVPLVHQWLAGV